MEPLPAAVDAIVVGAGPAGCTVSALLGRAGRRVLLVDQAPPPRPRLCTHALMPAALPVLRDLGVLGEIEAAGARRWWGVRLSMEGVRIEAALPRRGVAYPYGLNLRRAALDPILFAAATRPETVRALIGWRALQPLTERGAVRGLRLRAPDGMEADVRARIVVAANGRRSGLLQRVATPARTLPNRHIAWIAYLDGLPDEERPCLEAYYRAGRSVSLLPTDSGLWVAGVIAAGNRWSRTEAPAAMLALMRSFPELRARLSAARVASSPVSVRGLRNAVRFRSIVGMVPAGDAALQSDPAFGQGITWALRGGRRLARAIDDALARPGDEPLVIPLSATREPLALPLMLCMSAFSAITPGSLLERIVIRGAAQSPRASALALRFAAGFATAAPDGGAPRTPSRFLAEALRAVGV